MKPNNIRAITLAVVSGFAAVMASGPASAAFTSFVIRNSTSPPTGVAPTINTSVTQTEFVITIGGQKAGFGSNEANGVTLGDITNLYIDRIDDRTRFTAGSGPYVAPYLNLWITDGTNFAVVANEPSDGNFQPLYSNGYNLSFTDLSDKQAKIFENADKSWLPSNGIGLTFADLAGFQILAPTVAQLTVGWAGLGSGAPREIGTNVAYGVNWVFGDTLANYVSDNTGYIVGNDASISVVPVPAAVWLFGSALGLLGVAKRRIA
ncbi:MAG: VPLPA-CTERM sorting domain-containing protein [Gammaproteobacteria bacterium]